MPELPSKVLMVGSMNIDSVPEVFRTVGPMLGRRLRSLPDGEPGPRRQWVGWQLALLYSNPALARDPTAPKDAFGTGIWIRLADGVDAKDLHIGSLGYAHAAKASYAYFLEAREAGDIADGVKFQVCLPTPYAVATIYCPGRDFFAIEREYERAMIREVEEICGMIPHDDLALQWDVCQEMIAWDGQSTIFTPAGLENVEAELVARVKRLAEAVPRDVDIGIHLCYGDPMGKHIVEPVDAAREVSFANEVCAAVDRELAYVHMPVPVGWLDRSFYRPLENLDLPSGTDLYLGCIHPDGNMARRLELASEYVERYGIASECGISRARTRDLTMRFLETYRTYSQDP